MLSYSGWKLTSVLSGSNEQFGARFNGLHDSRELFLVRSYHYLNWYNMVNGT